MSGWNQPRRRRFSFAPAIAKMRREMRRVEMEMNETQLIYQAAEQMMTAAGQQVWEWPEVAAMGDPFWAARRRRSALQHFDSGKLKNR